MVLALHKAPQEAVCSTKAALVYAMCDLRFLAAVHGQKGYPPHKPQHIPGSSSYSSPIRKRFVLFINIPYSIEVIHIRWPALVFNKNKQIFKLINKFKKLVNTFFKFICFFRS